MSRVSNRRVKAIVVKELREYRHNGTIVVSMGILPLLLCVQPLIVVFGLSSHASSQLRHEHVLLYLLIVPAVVPSVVASYSVVGERLQGALEPLLTTPITRAELLLGKAAAAFLPSVLVAYAVLGVFMSLVEGFARPGIAAGVITAPDLIAQLVFTPLLVGWSIWLSIAISTQCADPRTAQQLSMLTMAPTAIITVVIATHGIPPTLLVALSAGGALLILNRVGWTLASRLFNRERLITSTR